MADKYIYIYIYIYIYTISHKTHRTSAGLALYKLLYGRWPSRIVIECYNKSTYVYNNTGIMCVIARVRNPRQRSTSGDPLSSKSPAERGRASQQLIGIRIMRDGNRPLAGRLLPSAESRQTSTASAFNCRNRKFESALAAASLRSILRQSAAAVACVVS